MRHSRRGFTLIEILVVIGIILVLVGLLVAGFRHLNRTAANKETIAEMKVCQSMLANYTAHGGMKGIEEYAPQKNDTNGPPNTPNMYPVYSDPVAGTTTAAQWKSLALTDIKGTGGSDLGGKGIANSARYSLAVLNTLDVMYVLMRIPANQTTVQSIQSKRIMEPIPPATSPNPIWQGAVLLDGWGNPIIFVPAAGLHVNVKDPASGSITPYVVRSTGTFNASSGDPPMTGNERPFWASGGQDGDFTLGEDNVYSFQD